MRVAFLFNAPRAWDWPGFLQGEIGLSGTDAQVLKTSHNLSYRDGIDVLLLQNQATTPHPRLRCLQVSTADEAFEAASAERVDVLVFNNRGDDNTCALLAACQRGGQRSVVWDQNGPSDVMANLIADCPAAKRLVCVSAVQTDLIRHHRVFDKTELIYNSIDPLFFYTKAGHRDPKHVVYVGCLVFSKGFHLLAAAWPAVHAAIPDATLSVLGSARLHDDGAELGPLGVAAADYEQRYIAPYLGTDREACAALGVRFRGLVSPAEIRDELQSASVGVVNPHTANFTELFCVSAAEIEASGAAVIGGRASGLFESVRNGRSGLLVSGQHELSQALIALLNDPARAAAMGQFGQRFVAGTYAPGRNTDRWAQLLLDVVCEREAQPPPLRIAHVNGRVLLRESLRRGRGVPWVGKHVPTLEALRRARADLRSLIAKVS